jgi:hypothetical protein
VSSVPTDVWVEDTPYNYSGAPDTGGEPDSAMAGQDMWLGRAIWVRNTKPSGAFGDYRDHENPVAGLQNYVHVLVKNRHPSVAADNTVVEVYWANASTGLTWPSSFHLIGTQSIATLAPGAMQEVGIPWTPTAVGHFCLVTRLLNAQDPFAFTETSNIGANTRNNNNIAWRNTTVVSLMRFISQNDEFLVRNISPSAESIDLKLRFRGGDLIADGGEVLLDLGLLFGPWIEAGQHGSNIDVVPETTRVRLLADPATIAGIPLAFGQAENVTMIVSADEPVPYPGTFHEYDLEVRQIAADEAVGGVAAHILTRALDTDTDGDGIPDMYDPDDDNDGVSDAAEMAKGTNPLQSNAVVQIPTLNVWGLAVLCLLLGGAALLRSRRRAA